MSFFKSFLLSGLCMSACSLYAQSKNEIQDSTHVLETVVVTANKIEQKQRETAKVMTVITSEELRRYSARSVAEILNQQVGIMIGGASGTPGSVQTLYVRGAAAANTLIMLDGVPMYDASGISSEFDLNTFLPSQIERIEIVKGAESTLYGSDAVAGVINIITKKANASAVGGQIDMSLASANTQRFSVAMTAPLNKRISLRTGYAVLNSDGISSSFDSSGVGRYDRDGMRQHIFTTDISARLSNRLALSGYFKYNRNRADIDAGAFTDDKDYQYGIENIVAGLRADYRLPKGALHMNYMFNRYDRTYRNDSFDIGGYSSDPFAYYTKFIDEKYAGAGHFAEAYATIPLHPHVKMIGGVDYRLQSTSQEYYYLSNFGPYQPLPLGKDTARVRQFSGYASFLFSQKNANVSAGFRYNNHSVYGHNTTFSVNPSLQLNRFRLFVNLASAYRIPSLYQLFSEYGNKNLKPEQSVSAEAGVDYSSDKLTFRVTTFRRDIRDVFYFYTDPVTFLGQYVNKNRQEDMGIETELAIRPSKSLTFALNHTYIDGKITETSASGKDSAYFNLYRRPRHLLNLHADYSLKGFTGYVHVRVASLTLQPVFGQHPVRLDGFYTADLGLAYQTVSGLRFFADLRNLTDQVYFEQLGFSAWRLNIRGGVQVNF